MICPLCTGSSLTKFDEDKLRSYFRCEDCSLVSVPRESILSFDDEANRYERHQNDLDDPNYREYLTQIVESTRASLTKDKTGLDFGCGKTTLLSKIYGGFGIQVDSYDLYFHPKEDIWKNEYDFIVLSEVIEHLRDPIGLMEKLSLILKPKGRFFIKTKLYPPDGSQFPSWFYKRDPTHVQFFDYDSLHYMAKRLGMEGPKKLSCPDLYELGHH